MKFLCAAALLLIIGCKPGPEKPDNLLDQNTMVDILYDLALVDAIRSHNPLALESHNITPTEFIYKKYDIDSVQFVQSNKYYAADIARYKEMYDEVSQRIESNKAKVDTLLKKASGNLEIPEAIDSQPSEGIIR